MELLRGPTDNLYKFLALSGLALAVVALVLANNLYIEWVRANVEANVYAESVEVLYDYRSLATQRRYKHLETQTDLISKLNTEDSDAIAEFIRKVSENQSKLVDEWLNDAIELHDTRQEARLKTEYARSIEGTFWWRMSTYGLMMLVGLGLSVWGFILWYHRLQKFLDAKVRSDGSTKALSSND